jgi:catechol 2,3-dioxygenase-like lactoylglutathione lyase family enzyme
MAKASGAWQADAMQRPSLSQQVTFLYAETPEESWRFYGEVMGLALVQDQGSCRIYAADEAGHAFLGVCRARAPRASDNPRVEGGVVFTFVTPEVEGWREFLAAKGVDAAEVEYSEAYRVTHFFFRDPAGYLLEVQRFEREDWPPAPGPTASDGRN